MRGRTSARCAIHVVVLLYFLTAVLISLLPHNHRADQPSTDCLACLAGLSFLVIVPPAVLIYCTIRREEHRVLPRRWVVHSGYSPGPVARGPPLP